MTGTAFLIGDIGGTNARFALGKTGQPGYRDEATLRCRDYDSIEAAIGAYLASTGATQPGIICLAAAGPVRDGEVQLTNHDWRIVATQISRAAAGATVRLLNDFEAVALGLPFLEDNDCMAIGPTGTPSPTTEDFTYCVLGPGTGLGCAGLRRYQGQLVPIVSEAGHTSFAPQSDLQIEVLQILQDRFGRVSNERLVCGSGLSNLHQALARIEGVGASSPVAPADIFTADADGDPLSTRSVDLFLEILGQVAGDLVLAYGAFRGTFIAGGILPRYPARILRSAFRDGFENKGRFRDTLAAVPTALVTHPQPGLLGACAVANMV